jgi:phage FluMu protein Com
MKEDRCAKCGILLTDANWQPTFKKRHVRRCKACHLAVCTDWESRNPGHAAKRQKTYHKRHPERGPAYYREHQEEYAQRAISRLWKMKIAAIEKLGGRCVACGIDDMRVLQINHLNGRNGDRKEVGDRIYKKIIAGTRVLDDLDVRCANCNVIYEYERGYRRTPIWFTFEEGTSDEEAVIETLIKEEEESHG